LGETDPFAATVILQLSKKRAINVEDEIHADQYTDEKEKELMAKVHEAN